MTKKITIFAIFCITVAAIAGPTVEPVSATGCHYCAHDEERGSGCLLGCPTDDLECWGIENCEEIDEGCRGTGFCDPLETLALSDGSLIYADGSDTPMVERAAFFIEEGASRYRRMCDAAIIGRSYDQVQIEEYLASSKMLVL